MDTASTSVHTLSDGLILYRFMESELNVIAFEIVNIFNKRRAWSTWVNKLVKLSIW